MHGYVSELVAQILTQQKKLALPINPLQLIHHPQVIVQSVEDYFLRTPSNQKDFAHYTALEDGVTLMTQWQGEPLYLVLYNDRVESQKRKNFTLAHELGHIYLGHSEDFSDQEKEADVFAAELLAPRCMLWELRQRYGYVPPELVQETFGLTLSMAKRRLDHEHPRPQRETAEHKLWKQSLSLLPKPPGQRRKRRFEIK